MRGRKLKAEALRLLQTDDVESGLLRIAAMPARRIVNPLFSFFYHGDATVKWRAVSAMGLVVARLAQDDPESARVVMRRLMWNLNDESGGIGWGSPEAIGEITARSRPMADEYARILVSYLDPAGNFIEHPQLQRGVLWGMGRLAHARPQHALRAADFLVAFMSEEDPFLCGLAAWAAGPLRAPDTASHLEKLRYDNRMIALYCDGNIIQQSVGTLAEKALQFFRTPLL